jgi:oxygen-independent coproporphyrinogen-3 oxidase
VQFRAVDLVAGAGLSDLEQLKAFEEDGLLTVDPHWISVTPKGRLLIRNICMVFDRYLTLARADAAQPLRYSKTI